MAGCSGAISVPKPVSIPARAQAQAEQSGCEQGQGRGHRWGNQGQTTKKFCKRPLELSAMGRRDLALLRQLAVKTRRAQLKAVRPADRDSVDQAFRSVIRR